MIIGTIMAVFMLVVARHYNIYKTCTSMPATNRALTYEL